MTRAGPHSARARGYRGPRVSRAAVGLSVCALLAACATASQDAARIYRDSTVQAQRQGLLREDRAPLDAPFDNSDLARNFERVVFHAEFTDVGGELAPEEREVTLKKWAGPIHYRVTGAAATAEDAAEVARYAARLSRVTGLTIEPAAADAPANFTVIVAGFDERDAFAVALARRFGPDGLTLARAIADRSLSQPCHAFTFYQEVAGPIVYALVMIRGETSGLLRRSCIEEEMAQALGPINDYDAARPSIFNDDEEFALLTWHDEWILRLLYDPRLEPGMTAAEGMPIVRDLLRRLRPDDRGVSRPAPLATAAARP